ncbi:MAG: ATP synthase F0 subunit C [Polyangiaceae bacterium]
MSRLTKLVTKLPLFLTACIVTLLVPMSAFAQQAAQQVQANKNDGNVGIGIAAGLAIGLGALGGTLGQGRAAAAALEGISRNPGAAARIQTPMILGLALIESLVLFAFLIAILLWTKVVPQ